MMTTSLEEIAAVWNILLRNKKSKKLLQKRN